MSPITTFKCGIPLPGLGPFNFPDEEVPIEPEVDTPKRPTPPPPNPGRRPDPPPPPPPPPPSFGGGGSTDIKPIDDDDGGGTIPPTMTVIWNPEVGITNELVTFTITEPTTLTQAVWTWGDVSDPDHTFSNSKGHIYTESGVYNLLINCNYLDEEGETQFLSKQLQLSVIDAGSGGGNAPKSLPPPPSGSVTPEETSDTVADQIFSEQDSKNIYLSDLDSQTDEISKNPTGIYDEEISILAPGPSEASEQVSNSRYDTSLFSTSINLGVEYLLKKNNLFETWNSTYINQLTTQNVIDSINPEVIKDLKRIQKEDGEYFSDYDIYTTVFTSLVRGTILNSDSDGINVEEIRELADGSENQNDPQVFVAGVDEVTKEYAALGLLEADSTPINPKSAQGISINRLKNLKVLPTDINAKIPIIIDGVEHSRFVKVDGTILDHSSLAINDGYYLTINVGGVNKKLFCNTELSHTVFCSTESRAKAIKVLGGTNTREISVTSTYSQNLEDTVDLNSDESSPREDFYIFKLNASSISTTDALQSTLLKNTEAVYDLMDSSSAAGIDNVNDYVRHKGLYYKTMCVNHDDNILDYMLAGSSFSYKQEDILYNAPKTSISITNFVRQLPYFIIIFPTNRFKYLPYQTKSRISDINVDNNSITRNLTFKTLLNYKNERRKFIEEKLGYPEGVTKDVYGNEEIQNKIFFLNKDARIYKHGYRVNDKVTVGTSVSRTRSTFSLVRRILEDIDDTYVVDTQGTGKGVYYFDLFSRMTLTEFNKFKYLSNYSMILPRFANGAVNNLRLLYPVTGAGSMSLSLTGLKKQRIGKESKFPVINTTNDDRLIVPPTTDRGSEIVDSSPTRTEVATARARRRE